MAQGSSADATEDGDNVESPIGDNKLIGPDCLPELLGQKQPKP